MPAIPPEPPATALERLGRALLRRRLDLGYENRTGFARATGINLRLAQDLETAAESRKRLRAKTKAEIEDAYRLEPGSVDAALAGGEMTPLPPPSAARPYDLIREAGWEKPEQSPFFVRTIAELPPGEFDDDAKRALLAEAWHQEQLRTGHQDRPRRDRSA
jgi:hypothetical protein